MTLAFPSAPDDHASVGHYARRLFDAQHAASRREPAPTLAERRDSLTLLRKLVLDNEDHFCRVIDEDFGGRSHDETRLLEIVPTLNALRHAKGHLAGWMKPRSRPVDFAFQPAKAWIRFEPLGVIGIIAPWNYPLLLTLAPLIDALAAGNRVMLKPSELTPRFSRLLLNLITEVFPADRVVVVTGGVEEAQAFSALPFDHLLFTGSTAVGRKVMLAAAQNLTPVTLELGGKSPAIVCADYPLEAAARSLAFGKFVNAGQTCIAPDYVLVPVDKASALADAIIEETRRAYPTLATNTDYSAMITPRHANRLRAALDDARASGATVLTHEDAGTVEAGKIGPTVVLDAANDSLLLQDEIFGPVLPIVGYRTLDEALAFVAARDRPLALYCFTKDERVQDRILDSALSGGVTINGTLLHIAQDALPFGGIGPSGMGAYHGEDGFKRFSHARAVHRIGFINVFERLGPPWGPLARRTASILSRR